MEEKQFPRGRVAMRVAMVVLAVLLVCQTIFPMARGLDERRKGDASAAASERRLGNPMVSPLGGRGGGMKGKPGTMKGRNPQGGGGNPLSAAAAARSKGMMGRGPVRSTPTEVLDTVDFTAREGLLWHPISMRSVVCPAGEEDCDAVVRFCLIRIAEYQENPWKYPMAAMLQKMSQCQSPENSRAYRLSTLRAYVREHPDDFLQPSGFVYHETRTGSTLVANMLAHVPSNLVVSENSLAEEAARRCPQCTPQQRVRLSREMLLLLGNAKGGHTHLFFKFQDSTTLSVMTEAFPDVAWVFLFRDPVEVMVSNLKGAYGKRERFYKGIDFDAADNATANSLLERPKLRSAKPMLSPCLLSGGVDTKGKPREEICATRLKVLCQSAVTALTAGRKGAGRGAVVEYPNLPDVVEGFIYPDLFGMGREMLEEHLPHMSEAARMYSKSMANPESKFAVGMDASYKHVMAEKAYQEAAESTGLAGVYRELLGLQAWRKTAP